MRGTWLALGPGVRTAIISLLFLSTAACSSTQQAAVGAGIGGVGLVATALAVESMAPGCHQYTNPGQVCTEYNSKPTSPRVGVPLALGGLGVAVLGGVIMVTSIQRSEPPRTDRRADPNAPEEPAALAKTDAVGMAVARLVFTGSDGDARPTKLLDVEDTHSRLRSEGPRAALENLRVRTASDGQWHTLNACYVFKSDWQLTSLGTTAACAP